MRYQPAVRVLRPESPRRQLVLHDQGFRRLPVQSPRGRLGVLVLVVLLLRADALDVAPHRQAHATGILDRHPRRPLDRERQLVGALDPRHARRDLEVRHPAHREDAHMPLDLGAVRLATDDDRSPVGHGGPRDVVGELAEVVTVPLRVLGGPQSQGGWQPE